MAFDVICKFIGFLNAWQLHSPKFATSIHSEMSLISHPQLHSRMDIYVSVRAPDFSRAGAGILHSR